ncbi:MAG TPA: 6-bladed beta-propeller [Bacteroidota bacterium]|nr:6-bladed beta-propeller [Bacteroidota bacterium]
MGKITSIMLFLLFVVLPALFGTGCSGSREAQGEERITWPPPPDTPRIAFVRTYRGEEDFPNALSSVLGSLAGKSNVIKLARPFDVCVAADGNIFVTDAMQGVVKFDPNKKEASALGEKSVMDLKDPRGIACGHGKVFIGLAGSGKIAVLDEDGKFIQAIGKENQFPNPVDVVADTLRNRIYVVDDRLHRVLVYSESGDSLFSIGSRGTGDGQFNFPISAAVDSAGNVYVVDSFNYRVEIFDSAGKFQRTFGKQGDAYGTFARPKGIALDSFGDIYVLDGLHNNYQVFNNAGELLMFVGRYSPNNDGFENPVSIAIDGSNKIYVTDNLNGRLQVFQLLVPKN